MSRLNYPIVFIIMLFNFVIDEGVLTPDGRNVTLKGVFFSGANACHSSSRISTRAITDLHS